MCVCLDVCVCVWMHVRVCLDACACVCVCVCMCVVCVYIYTYVCMGVCMIINIMNMCVHTLRTFRVLPPSVCTSYTHVYKNTHASL